jgi:hypothetical protein
LFSREPLTSAGHALARGSRLNGGLLLEVKAFRLGRQADGSFIGSIFDT